MGWQRAIGYTYLQDGKVDHADYQNGVRTVFAYDGRGIPQVVEHFRISPYQNYSWREYWRDDRDRITAFQKSTNNAVNPMENGRGDRFRYDEEGQLVEAWYNAANPAESGNGYTRYDGLGTYDALGNRSGSEYVSSRGWMNFTRKDNGLNQYRTWLNDIATSYDDDIGGTWGAPGRANGVLMQEGNITAGYNALNQPTMMQGPALAGSQTWIFFGYDPLGRCVRRWTGQLVNGNPPLPNTSTGGTYFYYDGWNLIEENTGAGSVSRNYVHGARVDEIVKQLIQYNPAPRYFHYDARGHCTLQTDANGNIAEQYEYDAFGYPYFFDAAGTAMTVNGRPDSPWGNRFLFTGREWLSDLKLYDYRARMYQPELGRFLQPDPKEFAAGDYNLYRYCHNDPINKSDPDGLVDKDYAEPSVWSQNYNPTDRVSMAGHANAVNGLVVNGKEVTAPTVAKDAITAGYGPSKTIVELSMCGTGVGGKNSFAQKVANELAARTGVKPDVVAPDGNTANRTTVGDQSGKITAHSPEAQATKKGESGEMKHFTAEPAKKLKKDQ